MRDLSRFECVMTKNYKSTKQRRLAQSLRHRIEAKKICRKKQAYIDKLEAQKAQEEVFRAHGQYLFIYFCPHCKFHHLTKTDPIKFKRQLDKDKYKRRWLKHMEMNKKELPEELPENTNHTQEEVMEYESNLDRYYNESGLEEAINDLDTSIDDD